MTRACLSQNTYADCQFGSALVDKGCRDPGSNRGPSDLQSDALPTELSRLCLQFRRRALKDAAAAAISIHTTPAPSNV
jgi:hypothetical protein